MPSRLAVPTNRENIGHYYPGLWRHYTIDVAQSLLKISGTWTLVKSPASDQLVEGEYFIGGYEHVVDDATAAELTADGFGAFLTPI